MKEKAPPFIWWSFSYLNNFMVSHTRQMWNTLWPSLVKMNKRLEELEIYAGKRRLFR